QTVISRLESRLRNADRVCDGPRSGALPVMDPNHYQNLRTSALRHGLANITQLVSKQTIHNRPHCFDLNARRPLQETPLTTRHRRERSQWTQDHLTGTMWQWSTILLHIPLSPF
uniref:Transposase Tc1-like domain-containing protein n=1 Tax=Oryzias latipes TaxID=8090 RepID=A0A3P9KGA8_ORYLA